jgi:hypothetical protein
MRSRKKSKHATKRRKRNSLRKLLDAIRTEKAATRSRQTKKAQLVRNSPLESTEPESRRSRAKRRKARKTVSRKTAHRSSSRRSRPRVLRNVNDIPSADPVKIPLGKTPLRYVPWQFLPGGSLCSRGFVV